MTVTRIVQILEAHAFKVSESEDGDGDLAPFISVESTPNTLVRDCQSIRDTLAGYGIVFAPPKDEDEENVPAIFGHYDLMMGEATVDIAYADDSMLARPS